MYMSIFIILSSIAVAAFCQVINPDDSGVEVPSEVNSGTGFIQGDIYVGKKGAASNRNAIKDLNYQWPNGQVCYRFKSDADAGIKADVLAAISDFQNFTCIRFNEDTTGTVKPCIEIQTSAAEGCYSMLGRMYDEDTQPLQLSPNGCNGKGVAIHELMHALGFDHEQGRSDRSTTIDVLMENISEDGKAQFEVSEDFDTLGLPYDCNSVMHYGRAYFSKNGKDTMVAKNPADCPFMGNRKGFTKYDLKKLRKYYKCTDPEPEALSAGHNGGCAFIDGPTRYCIEGQKSGGDSFCIDNDEICPKTCVCDHVVKQTYRECAKTNKDLYSNCFELVKEYGKTECDDAEFKTDCARACNC